MAKIYDGRWRYIRNLGSGGQGFVVLVSDETNELPGELALKRLTNADSAERRARFERETKALEALNHSNILKIYYKQLEPPSGEKPFYVSEYCELGSLQERGAARYKDNVAEPAAILRPIVSALQAAHEKGIFHRDCKPANILFRADGTPVLCDFGICYVEDGALVTLSEEGVGSRNFIAPEMESGGSGEISGAVDVYSLAKVLYWMVSGGREIARDGHRNGANYLVSSIDRQRFEHMHMFLDKFVQADPKNRRSLDEFGKGLSELVTLVEGDFAPLGKDIAIRCRFCGLGTYRRSKNKPGLGIYELSMNVPAGNDIVAMWCQYCGHVELFYLKGSSNREWWDGTKRL